MSAYSVERTKQLITLNYSVSASVLFDSNYYNTDTAALCGPNSGLRSTMPLRLSAGMIIIRKIIFRSFQCCFRWQWIVKDQLGHRLGKRWIFYISYEDCNPLTGPGLQTAIYWGNIRITISMTVPPGNSRFDNFSPGSSIASPVFTTRYGNGKCRGPEQDTGCCQQ